MQTRLPCVLMRGGTSRGPFFLAAHLPADPARRDTVLLAAMGSPHPLQIDGIGGGSSLTSKVAIVGPSAEAESDVDYLFAQVSVDRGTVDTKPNCGNMLAAVGPFAIEAGLVTPQHPETTVRIRNRNTGALIEAVVQTPRGVVTYAGTAAIPGVPGTAAPVALRFRDVAGSKTGQLFPTGHRQEEIEGVPVTLIDGAMPMLLIPAEALGARTDAAPEAIEADTALMQRIEALRLEAGRRMGLGDVSGSVVPKPALIGPGRDGAAITARYLTPHAVHRAMAVTGGITLAAAVRMAGTVAATAAGDGAVFQGGASADAAGPADGVSTVRIAHPAGELLIELLVEGEAVRWAGVLRTARRIFEGHLLIPSADQADALPLMAAE